MLTLIGCLFGIKQTDHGNFIIPFDGDLAQSAGAIFNRRNNQYNNVEFYIAIMQCARIRDNQANVSVLSWYYSTLLQDISQMIPDMEAYQIRRIAVLLQREITVRVHDAALVPMNVSFGTRVFVKMVCLIPFAGQKGLWCMAVVDAAGVFLQKTDTVRELWKVVDYSE